MQWRKKSSASLLWKNNGPGQSAMTLDGYLFRPAGAGPAPAIVGLHGCSGMFVRGTGTRPRSTAPGPPSSIAWNSCSCWSTVGATPPSRDVLGQRLRSRLLSAAALPCLRGTFVFAGAALCAAIESGWPAGRNAAAPRFTRSARKPRCAPNPPPVDFRAAVAFYPGTCNERRQSVNWSSTVPLLVLMGAEDVWTPMAPCRAFVDGAIGRGNPVEAVIYPYHGFDAPNRPPRELPDDRTRAGVVPIVGTDPAAPPMRCSGCRRSSPAISTIRPLFPRPTRAAPAPGAMPRPSS
jgi:hypothetical protein